MLLRILDADLAEDGFSPWDVCSTNCSRPSIDRAFISCGFTRWPYANHIGQGVVSMLTCNGDIDFHDKPSDVLELIKVILPQWKRRTDGRVRGKQSIRRSACH
jgi:hypothetical protein